MVNRYLCRCVILEEKTFIYTFLYTTTSEVDIIILRLYLNIEHDMNNYYVRSI